MMVIYCTSEQYSFHTQVVPWPKFAQMEVDQNLVSISAAVNQQFNHYQFCIYKPVLRCNKAGHNIFLAANIDHVCDGDADYLENSTAVLQKILPFHCCTLSIR